MDDPNLQEPVEALETTEQPEVTPPPVLTDDDLDRQALQRLQTRGYFNQPQVATQPQPIEDDIPWEPKVIADRAAESGYQRSMQGYAQLRTAEAKLDAQLDGLPATVKAIAKEAFFQASQTNPGSLNAQAIEAIASYAIGKAVKEGKYTPQSRTVPRGTPTTQVPQILTDPKMKAMLDAYNAKVPADMRVTEQEYKELIGG